MILQKTLEADEMAATVASGKGGVTRGIYAGGLTGWIMAVWDLTVMVLLVGPISTLFFPDTGRFMAITATISIYLATSVFRSAGGFIFGHIGDILGRKRSMVMSLLGIGAASVLTGFIPTYSQAGYISIILLIALRALVGLFAGGEYGNSAVIVVENAPAKKRGLWGGLTQIGFPIGFILAALTYLAVLSFTGSENFSSASYAAGWRIVLWVGIIPLIAGIVIRMRMPESPIWEDLKHSGKLEKSPLKALFGNREARSSFFNAWIGMTGFALAYWLTAGFLPTLLPRFAGIDPPVSLYILMAALASSLVAYIIIGWMSDRIGRKRAIYVFSSLGIVFSVPMLYLLLLPSSTLATKALAATVLTFTVTGAWGIFPSYLYEKFPASIRTTGVGSTFNSGFLIGAWGSTFALMLSGPVPETYLVWTTSGLIVLGLLIAAGSAIFPRENRRAEGSISRPTRRAGKK